MNNQETTLKESKTKTKSIWKTIDEIFYVIWLILVILLLILNIFTNKPINITDMVVLISIGVMIIAGNVREILDKLEK